MPGAANRLGRKLRVLRNSFGMTQEQLAEGADISLKHLGEIERSRGNPTLATLEALAKALHVTLSDLIAFEDDQQPLDTSSIEIRTLVDKQDRATRLRILQVLRAMLTDE